MSQLALDVKKKSDSNALTLDIGNSVLDIGYLIMKYGSSNFFEGEPRIGNE
ncbi:MAG: hypothetical protein KAR11_05115 [Phycisphaerae bacterium]|nr:hypothetical protein [Phycisphaerae bacterium]